MYTVTRQCQWPEGTLVVEISGGGLDYSNPGALAKKYAGEFETFQDPREAVSTAVKIAKAWKKDQPEKEIFIGQGSTGGMTMPFDPMDLDEETFKGLKEWADEEWEGIEKCVCCGDPLGKERWGHESFGECDCCSEQCCEKTYADIEYEEEED